MGSLLRPREYIETAINTLKEDHTIPLDFNIEAAEFRRTILDISKHSPAELKQILFTTLLESFQREASSTDDVSVALFGREAEHGLRLLQLLDRQYAVIATNPPYMGSNYMDESLKNHVKKYYPSGKRDLYTAFILRCLDFCQPNGRVAMVTMHTWMFLHSFTELRAVPEEKLALERKKGSFTGILRETCIEALAHLGPNAFEEISGEVVQSDMHILKKSMPQPKHSISAFRLIRLKNPQDKSENLKTDRYSKRLVFHVAQNMLLQVSNSIITVYHLPQALLDLLRKGENVGKLGYVSWGVSTCNNDRFLRLWWEVSIHNNRWLPHVKGGGYCKWEGLDLWAVEWRYIGIAIKTYILERFPYLGNNYEIKVRDYTLNTSGWTFSSMAGKGLAVRKLYTHQIANAASPTIFTQEEQPYIGGFLNSIIYTFILRGLTTKVNVDEGYVASLPIREDNYPLVAELVNLALTLKKTIIACDVTERQHSHLSNVTNVQPPEAPLLHLIEGMINTVVIDIYNLSKQNIQQILDEIGTPAGWYSLIAGYDTLPPLPDILKFLPLPQELYDYLAQHQRIHPDSRGKARLKANLKALYEAGPKAKDILQQESDESISENGEDEEGTITTEIQIPTETFLVLGVFGVGLYPISIYWLLEELRTEGVRCKPEELRILEDRLSVIILRLLGHRWPKQLGASEPVSAWTVADGIVPLVEGTGKTTLANLVRTRLREEEGDLDVQRIERLLIELSGQSLEEWLRKRFFSRHISQFKSRPIAWHLTSTPEKGLIKGNKKKRESGNSSHVPAFECLLYYHACTGDALARIRTQYVAPLIEAQHNVSEPNELLGEETAIAIANERILELEAFIGKLRRIEEQGFACNELTPSIEAEPLDRWCGNGILAPLSRDDLLRNEAAWHVDINDGVRVNIAPLQLAGVLASDVLKSSDARKALVDRAQWRSDERRWVRVGKLPRCGWMGEDVPESSRWQELHKKSEVRDTLEIKKGELLVPTLLDVEAKPEKGNNE